MNRNVPNADQTLSFNLRSNKSKGINRLTPTTIPINIIEKNTLNHLAIRAVFIFPLIRKIPITTEKILKLDEYAILFIMQ